MNKAYLLIICWLLVPFTGCIDVEEPELEEEWEDLPKDDEEKTEEPVKGCMDPNARNYDSTANIDDGSCYVPNDCKLVPYGQCSGENLTGMKYLLNLHEYGNIYKKNLTGVDLSYATLTDANLYLADLTGANLNYADLTGASLRFAYLIDADLAFADLTDADLLSANLTGANFTGAIVTNADFYGTYWHQTVWTDGVAYDENQA